MENEKSLKGSLILFIIIIIVLFVGFIISSNNVVEEEDENVINLNIMALKDENRFLTIKSAIESFASSVKYKNTETIMKILDKQYVEENNINSDNVFDLIDTYSTNYQVDLRRVYQIKKYNNIYVYYAKAKLIEENFDSIYTNYKKNVYYKVTINENTLAFAIAPISEEEYLSKVGDLDE